MDHDEQNIMPFEPHEGERVQLIDLPPGVIGPKDDAALRRLMDLLTQHKPEEPDEIAGLTLWPPEGGRSISVMFTDDLEKLYAGAVLPPGPAG